MAEALLRRVFLGAEAEKSSSKFIISMGCVQDVDPGAHKTGPRERSGGVGHIVRGMAGRRTNEFKRDPRKFR